MKNKIVILMIVVLCIETIALSIVNRSLRREVSKYKFLLYRPAAATIKNRSGDVLPNLELKNLENGQAKRMLELAHEKTFFLFIFSTDCSSCDKAAAIWNEIYEEYGRRYKVLGISKFNEQAIKDYAARNGVKFPLYRYEQEYKYDLFVSLPLTLLVDSSGRIVESKEGIPIGIKNKIKEVTRQ